MYVLSCLVGSCGSNRRGLNRLIHDYIVAGKDKATERMQKIERLFSYLKTRKDNN